ncbi:hypothetical protein [Pelosinus propionicus]|uniref:N-acetyltransferase domain-containing protein n=1 Tax=Pelosinus propionicus DSM 13327 TaxID=1123291 RepID=A0A1I4JGX0_9FIRM|nr:hypothetical protein [Pelosinus propionicus]SFL65810.1 hypothetical protein SAMN04490355_101279 [Pelosinus propionicus DSM 13327]
MNTQNTYQICDITDVGQSLIQIFDCNSPKSTMTDFFIDTNYAYKHHKKGEAITKVLVDTEKDCIVGYFTLKCSSLQWEYEDEFTNKEVKDALPAIEISRFAIDKNYQGKKCPIVGYEELNFSDYLFDNIMDFIIIIRETFAGISGIILYSVDDAKALSFYKRQGFNEICGSYSVYEPTDTIDCIPMYKFVITPDNLEQSKDFSF